MPDPRRSWQYSEHEIRSLVLFLLSIVPPIDKFDIVRPGYRSPTSGLDGGTTRVVHDLKSNVFILIFF
jgi:hypothetical protein